MYGAAWHCLSKFMEPRGNTFVQKITLLNFSMTCDRIGSAVKIYIQTTETAKLMTSRMTIANMLTVSSIKHVRLNQNLFDLCFL